MYQYDGSAWVVVGDGDMKAATYDTDGDGIVDNAGKVNGHTVESDVPADAKFTDTVYTHPTTAGNKHIPSGGAENQFLMWNADGEAIWEGIKLLIGNSPDGGYRIVLDKDDDRPNVITSITIPPASAEEKGLMSSEDFNKLEGIEEGAEVNVVTAVEHETGPGVDWVEITLVDGTSYAVPRIVPQSGVIGQESLPEASTASKGIVQLATEIADGNTNVPTADMVFDYIGDLNVLRGTREGDPGDMAVVLESDDGYLSGEKIPLLQGQEGSEKIRLAHLPMDTEMSETSLYPVGNKTIKQYVDNLINNLPSEQFLDLTNTTYVDSFTWNATTYPNSTNPNLDGKPVLVLALKDNDGAVQYGFVSLNDLVDVYTGDGTHIDITGGTVSHKNSGATAGSYGQAYERGGIDLSFIVPHLTVDGKGHITAISDKTVHFQVGDGVVTIAAGQTSVAVDLAEIYQITGYAAYMDSEEVIVDLVGKEFSIAQAQTSDIIIQYTYRSTR